MTKKEFETKYEFLLAPDEPNSGLRKEFCRDLYHLTTLKKIERCGNCGAWLDDPSLYTQTELDNCKLVYCGRMSCVNDYQERFVTRDMAIDAGDLSLEGQIY